MQAMVYTRYGPPEGLHLQEVAIPTPRADEILIKLEAVSLNRSDWEGLIGRPAYARFGGLFRPARPILGSDIAGRVVAVGQTHARFHVGDEVFGDILGRLGGLAEYVCARGGGLALKPPSLSFEHAAALPQAGVIALQGMRTQGQVQPGQQVLINGAGGGAGAFAVQLAKRSGAEVTGVDNTGKLDFMRALGADHVLDYTQADFTRTGRQYDLILDLVAYRSVFAYARALKPTGSYFVVGGSLVTLLQILLIGPWIRRATGKKLRVLAVQTRPADLVHLTELVAAGQLTPVIDRRYPLRDAAEALRRLGANQALGKIIITIP